MVGTELNLKTNMNEELKKKIKELPEEVFYLLTADKAAELNATLIAEYDLSGVQAAAVVELVERVYVKELRLSDLYTQIKSLLTSTQLSTGSFEETRLRQFICDLVGYRFVPVADWLGEDALNYIRSLGGDAATYAQDNEDLKLAAAKELAADNLLWQEEAELPPLEADDGSPLNIYPDDPSYMAAITAPESSDEAEDVGAGSAEDLIADYKNILTKELDSLLAIDDYLFVEQFNSRLIALLVERIEAKDELVAILLNNEARIGTETIVVDGRQLPPTTGAWISYFISQKGSSLFDAVTLSDFLVNAANTKFLAPSDKAKLSRLLLLYRNLKFFPDSLVGDEPDKWEILTNVGEVNYRVIEDNQVRKLESIKLESSELKRMDNIVSTVPERNFAGDQAKVMALKALGDKYPAGSLERLAIDEEIKRLTTLK